MSSYKVCVRLCGAFWLWKECLLSTFHSAKFSLLSQLFSILLLQRSSIDFFIKTVQQVSLVPSLLIMKESFTEKGLLLLWCYRVCFCCVLYCCTKLLCLMSKSCSCPCLLHWKRPRCSKLQLLLLLSVRMYVNYKGNATPYYTVCSPSWDGTYLCSIVFSGHPFLSVYAHFLASSELITF